MEKPDGNERFSLKPRTLRSSELFAGAKEILIEHNQQLYRLMITKADKLILNK